MSGSASPVPRSVAPWICVVAIAAASLVLTIVPLDRARVQAAAAEAHARVLLDEQAASRGEPGIVPASAQQVPIRNQSAATGSMLRAIFSASALRGMRVVSVVPDAADVARDAPSRNYTIGVQGRFRDLLAFLAAISRQSALVDVRSADAHLADASAENGLTPLLNSTVHLTLYGAGGAR